MLDYRLNQGDESAIREKRRLSLPREFRNRLTMTPEEAAEVLGRSAAFVRELCHNSHVLSKRHDGRYLVDVDSMLEFLDSVEEPEVEDPEGF